MYKLSQKLMIYLIFIEIQSEAQVHVNTGNPELIVHTKSGKTINKNPTVNMILFELIEINFSFSIQ